MDTVDHDHRLTFGLMEPSPTLQWIPPFERTCSLTFFKFFKFFFLYLKRISKRRERRRRSSRFSSFERFSFDRFHDLKGLSVYVMCGS